MGMENHFVSVYPKFMGTWNFCSAINFHSLLRLGYRRGNWKYQLGRFLFFCPLPHPRAKGHQCQLCQLEMLQSKRDSHNCNTHNTTHHGRFQCQRDSGNQEPDNVQDERTNTAAIIYLFTKGEERELCKFKTLLAPGNSDNGNAP